MSTEFLGSAEDRFDGSLDFNDETSDEFELDLSLADLSPLELDRVLDESKAKPEQELPVEQLASSENFPRPLQDSRKMLARLAMLSGHQSGYSEFPGGYKLDLNKTKLDFPAIQNLIKGAESVRVDFVDEKREAERLRISENMKKVNADLITKGLLDDDDAPKSQARPRPVSSEVRMAAEFLGAEPAAFYYPRHVAILPPKEKLALLQECKAARDPVLAWNRKVQEKRPTTLGAMRFNGTITVYRRPGAPEQPALTGICKTTKDQSSAKASERWKLLAELGHVPARPKSKDGKEQAPILTKCKMTGDDLIVRKQKNGLTTWHIGPNIHGFGLRGAQLAVEAAALIGMPKDVLAEYYGADFVAGEVTGNVPEFIRQLANDSDAWAILASHTKHPRWGRIASILLAWRDAIYFKLDEKEVRESQRIGAKIAEDLKAAYPDQFQDNQ